MRHVILGNGAAAITAAEKIRSLKPDDSVTVVSREDTPVYSKCMLPDYVGGRMSREKLFIRTAESYKKNGIKLITGNSAKKVDVLNKRVSLENGESLEFDKLLAAIGGTPFIPTIEGLADYDYYQINSVTEADKIIDKAKMGGNAIVMGGGLTGIEMSFALSRLGMKVTLVEMQPKLLPLQLDADSTQVMAKFLEREGITVMTGTAVTKVYPEGKKYVLLSDGNTLEYDMLLIAVGTRPNLDFIKDSGIDYKRGILVDEYMKSSATDIYAAGDVAEAVNKLSNEYVTSYIWPNALAQGRCAAYNMTESPVKFSASSVIQNMVQMRDMPFVSMGLVNPKDEGYDVKIKNDLQDGIYKKLVIKDNILRGMILIGETKNANVLGGMINKAVDIKDLKDTLID